MTAFRITKLCRDEHGHWRARITPDEGETLVVTRRWGSWLVAPGSGNYLRELAAVGLREAPAALQERVRRLEGRERELVAARRREAAASGRVWARPKGASQPPWPGWISSAPHAERVRVRVRDLSPSASSR